MKKRIMFMGTPQFAVPTLDLLIQRGEDVIAVVTQPDRPKGRGQKMQPPPVKELAEKHGIPVHQPLKVREPSFVELVKKLDPEVIVVVAFGQILPKSLLEIPKYGCINVHASLLPKYRGAAPLNWCLINGEQESGVTTMLMDVGLDTGDMLLKSVSPVWENEDIESLHDRLSVDGAALLAETLDRLWEGAITPEKQNDALSNYAPMLKKSDGLLDWSLSAAEIHNRIRGLAIWPGAISFVEDQQLKLYKSSVVTGAGEPGTVIQCDKTGVEIACGTGSVMVRELQLTGKKRLDAASFLSGFKLKPGMKLTSLPEQKD